MTMKKRTFLDGSNFFFQLRVSDKVDTINYEIMQLLKGKLCTYNNKTTFECEDEIFLSRKKKKKIVATMKYWSIGYSIIDEQ